MSPSPAAGPTPGDKLTAERAVPPPPYRHLTIALRAPFVHHAASPSQTCVAAERRARSSASSPWPRTGSSRTSARADDSWLDAAKSRLPMGEMGQADEIADFPSRDRAQADFVVFLLSDRSGNRPRCVAHPVRKLILSRVDILSTKRYYLSTGDVSGFAAQRPEATSHERRRYRVVTDKVVIGTAPDSWGIWFAEDPEPDPGRSLSGRGSPGRVRVDRDRRLRLPVHRPRQTARRPQLAPAQGLWRHDLRTAYTIPEPSTRSGNTWHRLPP